MRILLTGANGFIGSHVMAALIQRGDQVVACVRNPEKLNRRFPMAQAFYSDFNTDTAADIWLRRLEGIDAVINCAGILQGQCGQSAAAIHYRAPAALFDACAQAGVRRVIQISAISATEEAGTEYAMTKLQADDHLRKLDLDWIVLRPSLVYAENSYGGTSLLRAFAALPFMLPVVGKGNQLFQPLHVDDLTRTIIACLTSEHLARQTLEPVGPQTLSFAEILLLLRNWLGLAPAPILHMPRWLVAFTCRIGDVLNAGPLRTTSLKQIEHGNTGDAGNFIAQIGFTPRRLDEALALHPAGTQDLWQARLYLARPLLTIALFVMWLVSGLLGLLMPRSLTSGLMIEAGLSPTIANGLTIATSLLDLAIAAALLFGQRRTLIGIAQLTIVFAYTIALTICLPFQWLDPLGSVLKNLPILACILVWTILAEER